MPDWKIQEINVRLEFAIQAPDYGSIIYDPYEAACSFPIAADKFEVLDPGQITPAMMSNAVLGLQFMETAGIRYYILYRRDDLITFASETERRQIALKISFSTIDPAAPSTSVKEGTTYYPIRKNDDHACPVIPDNILWSFLLLKEDTPPSSEPEYRLIHIRPGGKGSGPECNGCYSASTYERYLECCAAGCYSS